METNNEYLETLFIGYGVPQGSVLGPLLLLTYRNDPRNATIYSDMHHFADDTNFLYSSKSLKNINKKINFKLKNIVNWLRANKVSLETGKTERKA